MSKTMYEITTITGSYTNAKGEKKNRYQKLGSIIETKNGLMMKLDTLPITEEHWNGWAYLNEPKPREEKEDIPF
jgi:hypothetical protein